MMSIQNINGLFLGHIPDTRVVRRRAADFNHSIFQVLSLVETTLDSQPSLLNPRRVHLDAAPGVMSNPAG
jgi:hypothetical protein